jgi:hypothetical protein
VFDKAPSWEFGQALLQQEWSVDVVEDAYGTTHWQRKGLNKR